MTEEEPGKGGRVPSHGHVCASNLASIWRKVGGLKAYGQKDHLGSKCKNKDLMEAVIKDDYFLILTR